MAAYTPKVRVQKPAPHFSGTAVVDGAFEGKISTIPKCTTAPHNEHLAVIKHHTTLKRAKYFTANQLLLDCRAQPHHLHLHETMAGSRLRPDGMDFRLPYRDHRFQ